VDTYRDSGNNSEQGMLIALPCLLGETSLVRTGAEQYL
jgi:hypothetical protein